MDETQGACHGLRPEGGLQVQPPRVVTMDGPAGLQLVPGVWGLVRPVRLSEPEQGLVSDQIWDIKPIQLR